MARAKRSEARPGPDVFTAVIEADPEDVGYVVTFPTLPDLATQGETLEEARSRAEDCLRGYLDALRATSRALPGGGAPVPSMAQLMLDEPPPADAQAPAGHPRARTRQLRLFAEARFLATR